MTLLAAFVFGFLTATGFWWVLSMCRAVANADRCANCDMVKYKADAEREEWEREEQAMRTSSAVISGGRCVTEVSQEGGVSTTSFQESESSAVPTIISEGKIKGAILDKTK